MRKIDKIYKPNYISLKWLIHEIEVDMARVQLKTSNFLICNFFEWQY